MHGNRPKGDRCDDCPGFENGVLREVHRIVTQTDRKIDAMIGSIREVSANTAHLSKLDAIASGIEMLNQNLVGPATGRRQIPLVSHLLTIAILGAIMIALLVKNTDKDVTISPTGISISDHNSGDAPNARQDH